MIPIQKEEQIRTLLKANLSAAEIGRLTGVNHVTVLSIARAIELAKSVSVEMRRKIQSMLLSGSPVDAISMRTRIPRDTVKAIRRTYYLQLRASNGSSCHTCPTCGAVMLPVESGASEKGDSAPQDPAAPNRTNLESVAEDILQLRDLGLIKHPLFHSLANRAERVLHGKT